MGQLSADSSGFTIVEVLIVSAIIAALSMISIGATNSVRTNARGTVVLNGLRQTERALNAMAVEQGVQSWWLETSFGVGSGSNPNPQLQDLIDQTQLKEYIQEVPEVSGAPNMTWSYDNDTDIYDGCSANGNGVNLLLTNVSAELASYVDTKTDDGNASCGEVRWVPNSNGTLVWSIARQDADLGASITRR